MIIRAYRPEDRESVCRIHDAARQEELRLSGLEDAYLPLAVTGDREGLWDYPGLFVAEDGGTVLGFAACSETELAWLYVEPGHARQGIGSELVRCLLARYPGIRTAEVLEGNYPAAGLYERFGFIRTDTVAGRMPGNEEFEVTAWIYTRKG